ncbi:FKBP-type peptidyl-prolyl cis-trans isomerase [Cryobacterium aureum]|uniref:FKBP-type peptidyl-prolyl cis-trans isomerase n=1 Tax=Cryobacterium aureum TaxID=995037 RepID=UPI000CF56B72|nr:FKBP-type peptidyl-prolyl cis-trans isomerase [Cryobacterium aureum]
MRKASALIITAGLVMTALTACATPGTAQASCETGAPSGAASKLVSVNGDFGAVPDVSFPTPLKSSTTQRTEIIAGSGQKILPGQMVSVESNLYNGTTGEPLQLSAFDGSTAIALGLGDATIPGIVAGLVCARVGERIAVVIAPDDGIGVNDQLRVGATDSLVFVVDIVKAFLPRADGADQAVANGLPAVVLDADGTPGIVLPSADVPKELEFGVLKKGTGEKVASDATVVIHYTGLSWASDKVFDSTWATRTPRVVPLSDLPQGLATAISGQTIGSQLVVVIPPALGFGAAAQGQVPANSTLVYAVDILGVN